MILDRESIQEIPTFSFKDQSTCLGSGGVEICPANPNLVLLFKTDGVIQKLNLVLKKLTKLTFCPASKSRCWFDSLLFSPNGTLVLVCTHYDYAFYVFHVSSMKLLRKWKRKEASPIIGRKWLNNCQFLITYQKSPMELFNIHSAAIQTSELTKNTTDLTWVYDMDFCHSGSELIIGGNDKDKYQQISLVKVRIADGKREWMNLDNDGCILAVKVSRCGKFVLSSSSRTFILRSEIDGTVLQKEKGWVENTIYSIQFSPNDTYALLQTQSELLILGFEKEEKKEKLTKVQEVKNQIPFQGFNAVSVFWGGQYTKEGFFCIGSYKGSFHIGTLRV